LDPVFPGNLLLLGRVAKPHGLKGLVKIRSYARSGYSFLDAGAIFLRPVSGEICEFKVLSVRPLGNDLIIELDGLNSIDHAEKFRGAEVLINKERLTREEEEYFWYELIGLKVYLDTGKYLGAVSQIISAGSNDIYEVRDEEKEVFIPATHEAVKEIDLENRKMVVSAMEGLLNLNEV